MVKTLTQEKLVKILAVLLTLTICTTRISMAAGQIFQGLALLTGIILFFRQGRCLTLDPESKRYYTVALAFFAGTLVSAIGAVNPGTVVKEFFNMWIWRSVIFVLIAAFIHRRDYLVNMLAAYLVVMGLEGFAAAGEAIVRGGRGWGFGPATTNSLALCGMMCLILPTACIILYDSGFETKLKRAAAFCTAGILGGQLGAQSRAAWLTALISMPIAFTPYARKSLKYLTVVLSIAALITGVFAVRPQYMKRLVSSSNMTTDWSNTHRLWLWESCINMFKDHPVNGIGLGNFQEFYKNHGYWMHNGKGELTPAELRQQTNPAPKKATAKQAPVKKAVPQQKAPAKQAPVKKAVPQQKAPAKQAPVKKAAPQQKATAKQASLKKGVPQQKAPVKQAPAKQNTVKKAAVTQQKPAAQKRVFVAGHAHNSYFQLLAETGVIGFAGLLFFVLYYLGSSLRNWLREKQSYDLMFFTSFLSFFVLFAQVEHIVDNSAAVRMMWFLLAILLQMKRLKKEGR